MTIEDIEKKILADAKVKATCLKEDAEAEVRQLLGKAEQEAKELRNKIISEARQTADRNEKQVLALTRLAARDQLIAKKQEIVSGAFSQVLEELSKLKSSVYEEAMSKIFRRVGRLQDEIMVVAPKGKEKKTEEIFAILGKKLFPQARFKIAKESVPIAGGFILKTKDMQVDGSFEALLNELKPTLESEVFRVLFGG